MIEDSELKSVTLAIRSGRNEWTKAEVTLRSLAGRLIGAEGVELTPGPLGLSGTIYVVKESISRDNRTLMRIERRRFVNGKIVDAHNLGEVEALCPSPSAALEMTAVTPIVPEMIEVAA